MLFSLACLVVTAVALNLYFRAEARYWKLRKAMSEALHEGRQNIGGKEAMQSTLIVPIHIWIMADKSFTKMHNILNPPKQQLPQTDQH